MMPYISAYFLRHGSTYACKLEVMVDARMRSSSIRQTLVLRTAAQCGFKTRVVTHAEHLLSSVCVSGNLVRSVSLSVSESVGVYGFMHVASCCLLWLDDDNHSLDTFNRRLRS